MRLSTLESSLILLVSAPCTWFGASSLRHSHQSDPQWLYYMITMGAFAVWIGAIFKSDKIMRYILVAAMIGMFVCACGTTQINIIKP